jgi:hypothetical protein
VRGDLALQPEGLLAFFLDPAGVEGGAAGSSAVVFFEASKALAPMTSPNALAFDERAVTVKEIWTPPPLGAVDELLGSDEAALRVYGAAFADYERANAGKPAHRVGGHPLPVQDPMEEADERLLLQLDSDDAREMCWGDMGRLYFLLSRPFAFERARCVLQST